MRKNQHVKQFVLISISILMFSFCSAQVAEEWVARFDGPAGNLDESHSMTVDGAKNVYVTGKSLGVGDLFSSDYATIKYNEFGVALWVRRYNGTANGMDIARAIAIDNIGNVYVTGSSEAAYPGWGFHSDYTTVKYNASGVLQWVARYNGPGNDDDVAVAIVVDSGGNVYVTGSSRGIGTIYDYATIKYNGAGVLQWVARYNGPGNGLDFANSIALDGSGNIYITGESTGSGSDFDFATIKYKATGVMQWVRSYNGPINGTDQAKQVKVDNAGNAYITGGSEGIGSETDYATIKYNTSGVQQWLRRYNGPGNSFDDATSLAVDNAGSVYVTGSSGGIGSQSDFATLKYSSGGALLWTSRYNGPDNNRDGGRFLVLDASANVYITGTSESIATLYDIVTIKYNSFGTNLWMVRYNGEADGYDLPNGIAVDAPGFVYITGITDDFTDGDYVTIKYSQSGLLASRPVPGETNAPVLVEFRVSNFPNPVSSTARIQYELPFDGQLSIRVYDVTGREVETLINGNIKTGHHSTYFDASALQNGVYYYKALLQRGEKELKQTGKMIVIK